MSNDSISYYADSGPSPNETDAMAWASIDEASQRKRCSGARSLNNFIRDRAHSYITPKGDVRTNIIDQGDRITYAFNEDFTSQLFQHLEACRLEGTTAHFSERQGSALVPRTGIMLDYDMIISNKRPILTDRHYYRMAGALIATLQRDIDFTGGKKLLEIKLHVFFIIKREPVAIVSTPATYKYGIHILLPGIKVGRAYKKWLLRQFQNEPSIMATLQELGAVGDISACLDQNSASVPVLFFGSCKRGSIPYILGAALEITIDTGCDINAGWTPPPIIRKISDLELVKYNLVAELSLTTEADYADKEPLVKMYDYDPRPEIINKVQDWGNRSADNTVPAEELLLAEHTLSTLTLHNAEARHLHALLDILDSSYYSDRGKWRDVIFALANTNDQYKPLAVWFSHKCPHKWADGGISALDSLWDDAIARKFNSTITENPLTLRSILYWAKSCDPSRYVETMERSYFTMLTSYVYDHGGKLQHYMIAKVLYSMLSSKFCVDIDAGARGSQTYCWFEFVLPGQSMKAGELWKWRKEVEPDDVQIYMSEKLTRVLDQISEHIEEKRIGAADEAQGKYYKGLGKAFAISKQSLYNDTFKNGVIRQANYLFRRRGFVDLLDKLPDLFGTLNGVLKLGPKCTLIDHFHEYPISRFSTVAYNRLDPLNPDYWQKLVFDAIADIIIEPDARDWILFHAAQGLSGEPKEGLMLLWEGGGQNGKTSFLRWVAKALGPYADKFNIQLMCSEREDADRPNSAMMKFKYLNYAYSEESNKAQTLNVARMKEMVNAGEVSGRELNNKQETFTMKANVVAASQYSFIINTTDHGTWRRLRHYTSKTKFRKNPDPNNIYEKKDDQRFVRQYPTDPQFQSAFLSILVHYYERLQKEYEGQLKNVYTPTIEKETEVFRIGQDSLHRWISQSVVISVDNTVEYPLSILSEHYMEWYSLNIERKRHVPVEIIKEIESSALGKYLRPASNRTLVLRGCRILTKDEIALRDGEEMLVDVERRGQHSPDEWAEAISIKNMKNNWWLSPTEISVESSNSNSTNLDSAKLDEYLQFNDDKYVIDALQSTTKIQTIDIIDEDFDLLIETGEMSESTTYINKPVSYTLDDVYDNE